MMNIGVYIRVALAIALWSIHVAHADSLALVASDPAFISGAQSTLAAITFCAPVCTNRFSTVDVIDVTSSTPTSTQLGNYTDVLAWVNSPPSDSTALGDALANFYDLGGKHLTIASFAFANLGGIGGRVMSGPYVGLVNANTYANPSGNLVAVAPTDPVFSGITLSNVTYYHSSGFANPAVVSGATSLATDGAGMNMIVRSANGVMNINLYPGLGAGKADGTVDNNADFYKLVANTFVGAPSTGSSGSDTIPPTTTATVFPPPNLNGWNKSNVTVTVTAVDNAGGSGVKQISYTLSGAQLGSNTVLATTASIVISAEGTTTVSYFSTDNAGNAEAPKTLTVLLDETPPSVIATVSPNPDNGLNTTPVTVTFSGTDTLSGVASCTPPTTVSTNGAGQVVTGTCTDRAGNSTAVSKTVNIQLNGGVDPPGPAIQGIPVDKCILWPPNGRMVQVAALSVPPQTVFNVTATSNETADSGESDILITGTGLQPRVIQLRAQRSGRTGARIYTVTATAADSAGTTVGQFTCTVPHDQQAYLDDERADGDR
jgi:hypothetical protein